MTSLRLEIVYSEDAPIGKGRGGSLAWGWFRRIPNTEGVPSEKETNLIIHSFYVALYRWIRCVSGRWAVERLEDVGGAMKGGAEKPFSRYAGILFRTPGHRHGEAGLPVSLGNQRVRGVGAPQHPSPSSSTIPTFIYSPQINTKRACE